MIVGDADGVLKCLAVKQNGENLTKLPGFGISDSQKGSAITFANGTDPDAKLIEVLGGRKEDGKPLIQRSVTTTSFDANGMNRVTLSDFGLIGTIIEQFGKESS